MKRQYASIDIARYVSALLVVCIHTFPFLEIIVFLHGKSNWWGGVYCAKYATWSRQSEMITEIYNQNIGSHLASKIRFDKNAKKLYITPYEQNMICDIYILEIPATVS